MRIKFLVAFTAFYVICPLVSICRLIEVVVDLGELPLPEEFNNDKLPNKNTEGKQWFPHFGELEEHPEGSSIHIAETFNTEFKISRRNLETHLGITDTFNCWPIHFCRKYPYDLDKLLKSGFDPTLRTVIIIDGYRTQPFNEWQNETRDIWLELEDVNVILVAWSGGNQGIYFKAVGAVKMVARQTTVLLYYLARIYGIELGEERFLNKIHLVGFSLGAHIAGAVGYDLDGKVARITGLDPAGPCFNDVADRHRLDRTDAQLVDVLHTNSGQIAVTNSFYGIWKPIGHVDFYANDGKNQPGCNVDLLGCSHNCARIFYSSFLNHTIRIRELAGREGFHETYRLSAIRSLNYEQTTDATSLIKYCPKAIAHEGSLLMKDLATCIVPIDFAGGLEYRTELLNNYDIDLNPKHSSKDMYYFNTNIFPILQDINLVRVGIDSSFKGTNSLDCDLKIKLGETLYKTKGHSFIHTGNHFKMVFPQLVSHTEAALELQKLALLGDSLGQLDAKIDLAKLFPPTIEVGSSRKPVEESSSRDGILGAAERLFDSIKNSFSARKDENQCNFGIINATIQPLKILQWQVVAIYSTKFKRDVELFYLREFEAFPTIELDPNERSNGTLYIDRVVISLSRNINDDLSLENSMNPFAGSKQLSFLSPFPGYSYAKSTSIDYLYWILSAILLTIISALVIYLSIRKPKDHPEVANELEIVEMSIQTKM